MQLKKYFPINFLNDGDCPVPIFFLKYLHVVLLSLLRQEMPKGNFLKTMLC